MIFLVYRPNKKTTLTARLHRSDYLSYLLLGGLTREEKIKTTKDLNGIK